jgi:hypothetical protein
VSAPTAALPPPVEDWQHQQRQERRRDEPADDRHGQRAKDGDADTRPGGVHRRRLYPTGPEAEILRPLAVAVVGGLIASTFLTLLVLPVLYGRGQGRGRR